jgi:hypothetical protein
LSASGATARSAVERGAQLRHAQVADPMGRARTRSGPRECITATCCKVRGDSSRTPPASPPWASSPYSFASDRAVKKPFAAGIWSTSVRIRCSPAEWVSTCRTVTSSLPPCANSGQ